MKAFLDIEILFEVESLFIRNKWEIDSKEENDASLFNRFCQRLALFDKDSQKFIIELSHDFLKIGINDYYNLFNKAFKSMPPSLLQSSKHIYIFPLKKINSTESKSANHLWYYLSNFSNLPYDVYFKKVYFVDSPQKIRKTKTINSDLFVFLDDFIGTGDTAHEILSEHFNNTFDNFMIPQSRTVLLSLAAQAKGIENIKSSLHIPCYTGIIRKKGISERFSNEELYLKTKLMEGIESRLRVNPDYNFGYGRSEGLITLGRKSPNNTFPVYWHETKSYIAPFPRYKNYERLD